MVQVAREEPLRLETWDLELAYGGLAQLARAPALQAGGHRFDSDILHESYKLHASSGC